MSKYKVKVHSSLLKAFICAPSGSLVLVTPKYKTTSSLYKGVESIQRNLREVGIDVNMKEKTLHLKNKQGRIIASSPGVYSTKQSIRRAAINYTGKHKCITSYLY